MPLKIAGTGLLEVDLSRGGGEPGMSHVEVVGHVAGEVKRCLITEVLRTVVPSECYETFGLSAAESLALGTPVIASRIGGLPELLEHGRTGLLFPAGDVEALAECLRLISHKEIGTCEIAANALTGAQERFSPEGPLEQLLVIYANAVAGVWSTQSIKERCAWD